MDDLRNAVLKLAHQVPSLRKNLVPLLKKEGASGYPVFPGYSWLEPEGSVSHDNIVHVSQPEWDDAKNPKYLVDHSPKPCSHRDDINRINSKRDGGRDGYYFDTYQCRHCERKWQTKTPWRDSHGHI